VFGEQFDLTREFDGMLRKIARADVLRQQRSMQHHFNHREMLADALGIVLMVVDEHMSDVVGVARICDPA
jgi:hypothetical protein